MILLEFLKERGALVYYLLPEELEELKRVLREEYELYRQEGGEGSWKKFLEEEFGELYDVVGRYKRELGQFYGLVVEKGDGKIKWLEGLEAFVTAVGEGMKKRRKKRVSENLGKEVEIFELSLDVIVENLNYIFDIVYRPRSKGEDFDGWEYYFEWYKKRNGDYAIGLSLEGALSVDYEWIIRGVEKMGQMSEEEIDRFEVEWIKRIGNDVKRWFEDDIEIAMYVRRPNDYGL